MSAPVPVRALIRRSSRLSSALPIRSSQRCIHQSFRCQQDDDEGGRRGPLYNQTGPMNIQSLRPGQQPPHGRAPPKTPPPGPAEEGFPRYTEEELEFLSKKYTPEQMEALKAGENVILPQDLHDQGVIRTDYMKTNYLDDFSRIHPVLDKKRLPDESHIDPNLRFKTDEELDEDLFRWVMKPEGDPDAADWDKFSKEHRMTVGKKEAETEPIDYTAPELNKLSDPVVKRVARMDAEAKEENAFLKRVSQQTGFSIDYLKGLRTKEIVNHSVSNQTRMGKIRSMYVMMVVGNGNGLIGVGEGKHEESRQAIEQATLKAIRNMQPIPRYEDRTIYGDVRGKVSGTVVELYNRPPGFGVRCQEKIWDIARCIGITDLGARVVRGSNKMNTVKAVIQALQKQRLPEDVARSRNKKMVDVRKVYYANAHLG